MPVVIVIVGLFCLAIAGMLVVMVVREINKGIASGQFATRGGRLLKRAKQPLRYWSHFALMCLVGGGALVAGVALLRMIGAVFLAH